MSAVDELREERRGEAFAGHHGLPRRAILPNRSLQRLAALISQRPLPQRTRGPAQARWAVLVERACSVDALGLVDVPPGGVPSLARSIGVDKASFGRQLARWESADLVRLVRAERAQRGPGPAALAVDVVPVWETLAWLADHLARAKLGVDPRPGRRRGAGDDRPPTENMVLAVLYHHVERHEPLPTLRYRDEFSTYIARMKARSDV